MYRVPPDRAWWPAVGAPLERGVRQHLRHGDGACISVRAPFCLPRGASAGAVAVLRVCGTHQGPCRALGALQRAALGLTSWVDRCPFGIRVVLMGLPFNTPGPRPRLGNLGTCVEKRLLRCIRTRRHMTPTNKAFDMRTARDRCQQRRGFLCRVAHCGSKIRSGWLASSHCGRVSWCGRAKMCACAA